LFQYQSQGLLINILLQTSHQGRNPFLCSPNHFNQLKCCKRIILSPLTINTYLARALTQLRIARAKPENQGFKFLQLKEYNVVPCLLGFGFRLFLMQIRLFQLCQLKKTPNVSRSQVVVDE
jgi:hypothetical protein